MRSPLARRGWKPLRYAIPNLVTGSSLVFGMLSLLASYEGRSVDAAWLIIYAVLADRLDGFTARLLRGTSALGVQLDSLADFLNFGVAPAFLFFTSLSRVPALGFSSGIGRVTLLLACGSWVIGATYRLARFNVTGDAPEYAKLFFGVPTTLAAGTLVVWYLALLKYAPSGDPLAPDQPFGGSRLFSGLETPPGVWRLLPMVLFVGAALMASNLRMPKLKKASSRWFTAFMLVNVLLGYFFGVLRLYPEYLVWPPTMWVVVFLVWGQLSPVARAIKPPPLFPIES
jgi:CDP-diacylglycerol--serine O-phosphatidyltransferase